MKMKKLIISLMVATILCGCQKQQNPINDKDLHQVIEYVEQQYDCTVNSLLDYNTLANNNQISITELRLNITSANGNIIVGTYTIMKNQDNNKLYNIQANEIRD